MIIVHGCDNSNPVNETEEISTPNIPNGPSSGETNQSLSYTTSGASSNLGHSIEYRFDWGDGNYSNWSSSTSASHSWSMAGAKYVRDQARCTVHVDKTSDWSDAKLVVINEPGESVPALLSPYNGSTINDSSPYLDWSHVPNTDNYRVQVDDDSCFFSPDRDHQTSSTGWIVNPDIEARIWYWRVKAHFSTGWGNWSLRWSFTLEDGDTVPSAPTLFQPDSSSTVSDHTPTFDWNDPPYAYRYELKVDNNDSFISPEIHQTNLSNSTYTPTTELNNDTYYWKVRAKNSAGTWGNWSSRWSFTIEDEFPEDSLVQLTFDGWSAYADWSPDGSKFTFTSFRDDNIDIYKMNLDGSNQERLTNSSAMEAMSLWSPDGYKIMFLTKVVDPFIDEIYTMNSNGSNQTRLTYLNDELAHHVWSTDGSMMAFTSGADGNFEVYVIDSDGSNLRNLTNNPANDQFPKWFPDGSKIAFMSARDNNWEIYTMNSDGSNQINRTDDLASDMFPACSPDGSKIAFYSDRDGDDEIYVMNYNGSNQTRLTFFGAGDPSVWRAEPQWSPDGSRIAFTSEIDGNYEIYVIDSSGGNEIRLSYSAETSLYPDWSPDGEWISFHEVNEWADSTSIWKVRVPR